MRLIAIILFSASLAFGQIHETRGTTPDSAGGGGTQWNDPVAFGSIGTCDGAADNTFQPFTDSEFDYAFCNGTAWSYYIDGKVHSPMSLQTFEWGDNQETATVTSAGGSFILEDDGNGLGASGNDVRLYKKTVPAAPYTVEVGFWTNFDGLDFWMCGVSLWNSTSDDYITVGLGLESGYKIRSTKFTDHSTFNSNYYLVSIGQVPAFWVVKIEDNNTNRIVSVSSDKGRTFRQMHTESRSDFITPTDIGIFINPGTTSTAQGLCTFVYWDEE